MHDTNITRQPESYTTHWKEACGDLELGGGLPLGFHVFRSLRFLLEAPEGQAFLDQDVQMHLRGPAAIN